MEISAWYPSPSPSHGGRAAWDAAVDWRSAREGWRNESARGTLASRSGGPAGSRYLPLGHHQNSTLPLASRGRVCLRKGCGRQYQPSRWNQRYCGDPECRRLVRRWQAAKRQQQRRRRPEVRQQHAAAEQRRRACRQQESCQVPAEATSSPLPAEEGAWSRSRKNPAAFCDRPGCYEPCRDSCRCQARYCGDDCRRTMRRVRDRERKYLSRKTPSGRLKRRFEYQTRCAARGVGAPHTPARPGLSLADAILAPVGDYRSLADGILSSAVPDEVPADDRKTPADSRPRAPPAP